MPAAGHYRSNVQKFGTTLVNPNKIHKVMKEFKSGRLHSGSKFGPKVKNRKQALAIAIQESKK